MVENLIGLMYGAGSRRVSVLGPVLFVIYINDINSYVSSKILKFSDDTKIVGVVSTSEGVMQIRQDLVDLYHWSNDWQMLFNTDKCNVMHLGNKNPCVKYDLGGRELESILEEKYLGILITKDLKVSVQCLRAAKTANRVVGIIRRIFTCKDEQTIIQLYKSLVRPHLEYCVPAWHRYLSKNIEMLEKVQRRSTKMVYGFNDLTYEQRLRRLNITTLGTRRLRGDLIEVFKIDNVDFRNFFHLSTTGLRDHSLQIFKSSFKHDVGKYTFSNRVIDSWNRLPENIIDCESLDNFKKKLDRFFKVPLGG